MSDDSIVSILILCAFLIGIGISGLAASSKGALYQIAPVGFGLIIILACVLAGFVAYQQSTKENHPTDQSSSH